MSTTLTDVQPAGMPATASGATLAGYASCFSQWARISYGSKAFLERVLPGAFSQTITERGSRVRALLEHGSDARAGSRPIGAITNLAEDSYGLAYSVDLFDVPYVTELLPAFAAGLYSASFKFREQMSDFEPRPAKSAYNPSRLPEVSLRAVDLFDIAPVVYPAYVGASASLRSSGERPHLTVVPDRTRERAEAFELLPPEPPRAAFDFWFATPPSMATRSSGEDAQPQWASVSRTRAGSASMVATKTMEHRGQQITAGVTRVSESHPWLHELEGVFLRLDSDGGQRSIERRSGELYSEPKRTKKRSASDGLFWFADPPSGA